MADFRHPLSPLVMAAFADETCNDAIKIAVYLGAPMGSPKALKAYTLVAEDVLEVLRAEGFLVLGTDGWYRSSAAEQLAE